MTTCQYPAVAPTRENPTGECRAPAERAVALGATGRHLPVCASHAARYRATVPLADLEVP